MSITEYRNRFMRLTADRRIAWSRSDHEWMQQIDAEIADILDAYNSRPPSQQP
ncbi:hypothetical protein NWP13_23850 [Rhodococcus pyridinivorans]|nr:hypothetical protein [Rhodococcus pyridinivorans]